MRGVPLKVIQELLGHASIATTMIYARRAGDEVTLFKSLGISIEDLASAHYIYAQAIAQGAGVSVPLGPDPAPHP